MIQLRDYQKSIVEKATEVIQRNGFVYLAMEVRTGKTLTSLSVATKLRAKKVLFITKKKAISSIIKDYELLEPSFYLHTINYESLHKVHYDLDWDVIILDEAHSMGAFPKPSKRARDVKMRIIKSKAKVILLSGTPTPESYSQIYHQVYGIPTNPFSEFSSFYKFAHAHVKITERMINSLRIRDYSHGLPTIMDKMKPYMIAYSQKEAGFKVNTTEKVLEVEMEKTTYKLANQLKKHLVIEGKREVILADTPVKLMMKLHQLYSGTIKFESGNAEVLDYSKARFIRSKFKDVKVGIFYKFKAELKALKEVYGDDITTELSVFEDTDKSIALQIVSGREGISLRQAKCLVYYNIDFSATSYWQSRDRMTTKDRLENDVYWIFSKGGIEKKIYKAVTNKKDYTLSHFKKDLLSL
jgi:SNF2 family DNA or RNA helicase